jgi:hypothetical protein
MSAAIIGLVGVVAGAIVTGVINWLVQNSQARRQTTSTVKAIAGLTYDDYLHYQSTLVRALDRPGHWWDEGESLERQTSIDDRKLLLAGLDDRASQDVAAAQGWMDYLARRRHPHRGPTAIDTRVMRDTFCRLDQARRHLAEASGRRYSSFKDGAVLETLEHAQTLEELHLSDADCRARRAVNYGRPDVAREAVRDPLYLPPQV